MNDRPLSGMLRLGQITDLHLRHHQPGGSAIAIRRSQDMPAALAAALAELRGRGAQAVVLTGDLLDVPDYVLKAEEAYAYQRSRWLEEIAADYALVRRTLTNAGLPFLAVPGNHDAWNAFHAAFPEDELQVAGHRVLRFCDRQHGHHLLPQRVDAQRRAYLAALDDASLPQVHCQHYVLTPELNRGYPHTYWEHAELCRRLAAVAHVRLAVSGHYHAGTDLLRVGAATVTTCPAFAEAPHPYRLYEIGDDGATRCHDLALPVPAPRRAVFIDRDGVITVDASYRTGPEALRLIPGAAAALARLRAAGFATVVITNQSCVGMGYVTREMLAATHDRLCRLLRDEAGPLAQPDAIHASLGAGAEAVHPDLVPEDDAKPSPVLVDRARAQLGLAPGGWFIGDRPTDLACARRAGCVPVLVGTGDGLLTAAGLGPGDRDVLKHADLATAVTAILAS